MPHRISEAVVTGYIDNRTRGKMTGEIHLYGVEEPIIVELIGNPLRDLAGRQCEFHNPAPVPLDEKEIFHRQTGTVGDMTASKKVTYNEKGDGDETIFVHSNALYLEWFSEADGRVVLESADFEVKLSLPEWEMSSEEETAQRKQNEKTMYEFLRDLEGKLKPDKLPDLSDIEVLNEFEWELLFKENDARAAAISELADKYQDAPDFKEKIKRMIQRLDPDKTISFGLDIGGISDSLPDFTDPPNTFDNSADDPMMLPEWLGVNWQKREDGSLRHPVDEHMHSLTVGLIKINDELPRNRKFDKLTRFVFQAAIEAGGAFTFVTEGEMYDRPYIIAVMKRVHQHLIHALNLCAELRHSDSFDHEIAIGVQQELFRIRDDITDIVQRLRKAENGN